MIHTKEPANVFYVYLTAYRGYNTEEVNEIHLKALIKRIQKYPGSYGRIESYNIVGMFKEVGSDRATQERTLKVMCHSEKQAAELTDLACTRYEQDAALVVRSQTHTASLWSIGYDGEYPCRYPRIEECPLDGTFQQVDTPKGECYSVDDAGNIWEVVC